MPSDLPEIKAGLQARIVELCARLLPRGTREGPQWVSHNPRVAGDEKKFPALKVGLVKDKGAWRDWRNGDKGDVLALVAFCLGTDIRGAMAWARDYLGLKKMSREDREAFRRDIAQREAKEKERAEKLRAFKLGQAQTLFQQGTARGEGAAAERHALAYFAARGCAIEDVADLNRFTFRFSAATEWWKGAKWETRDGRRFKKEAGPEFPAVHTGMRQATGVVTCCHVTFLDPLQPAKAPVQPPKLMFGEAMGAVIEISCGEGGGPFWGPNERPLPLILCEGIETGLSLAAAVPEARVWAGGSLAGMGHAPVWLSCVAEVTVARDNNTGNAQAQAALAKSIETLAAHDKTVNVMASHVGDDFNDLMQGKED